jgi:hypothetical protein
MIPLFCIFYILSTIIIAMLEIPRDADREWGAQFSFIHSSPKMGMETSRAKWHHTTSQIGMHYKTR